MKWKRKDMMSEAPSRKLRADPFPEPTCPYEGGRGVQILARTITVAILVTVVGCGGNEQYTGLADTIDISESEVQTDTPSADTLFEPDHGIDDSDVADDGTVSPLEGVVCGSNTCFEPTICCWSWGDPPIPRCSTRDECRAFRQDCDGPEDCSGAERCCFIEAPYSPSIRCYVGEPCPTICHTDDDCGEERVCCEITSDYWEGAQMCDDPECWVGP